MAWGNERNDFEEDLDGIDEEIEEEEEYVAKLVELGYDAPVSYPEV